MLPAADDIIRLLGLKPHPEGGHYRETFRDVAAGTPEGAPEGAKGRAHSTAIYFLLRAGEVSRWHRVDAAEVWHWYAGAALKLTVADAAGRREARLGVDLAAGERPQAVVPAHAWQQAQSLGAWTLVGCTVAPGFDLPASSWRRQGSIRGDEGGRRSGWGGIGHAVQRWGPGLCPPGVCGSVECGSNTPKLAGITALAYWSASAAPDLSAQNCMSSFR